jgi:hypothetical protein
MLKQSLKKQYYWFIVYRFMNYVWNWTIATDEDWLPITEVTRLIEKREKTKVIITNFFKINKKTFEGAQ